MMRFLAALGADVHSRSAMSRGTLQMDAIECKKSILTMFISHGAKNSLKLLLLAICATVRGSHGSATH